MNVHHCFDFTISGNPFIFSVLWRTLLFESNEMEYKSQKVNRTVKQFCAVAFIAFGFNLQG
jgi:hypothetical protein